MNSSITLQTFEAVQTNSTVGCEDSGSGVLTKRYIYDPSTFEHGIMELHSSL